MISSLELARICGVSQGTVDRALHGRAGISPATRERILAAAKHRGYRPNPAARELITGKSTIVGALVPSVNNIFFMDVFNGLAQRLRERNLQLQLTPVESQKDFLGALEGFAARRHRMALVIPPEEGIPIPRSIPDCLPVISLISPCKGPGIHFLTPDEEKTGCDAVKFLYQKGHRRIAHLTYSRKSHAIASRARGYEKQMRKSRLKPLILADVNRQSLSHFWKTQRPTAFFCHNDWLALQAGLLLSEMRIRVPEDVSILGTDNSPTFVAIHPHLTTLAYPTEALCQAVLDVLDARPRSLTRAKFEIVERASVRPL